MKCPDCNAEMPQENKFCTSCGHELPEHDAFDPSGEYDSFEAAPDAASAVYESAAPTGGGAAYAAAPAAAAASAAGPAESVQQGGILQNKPLLIVLAATVFALAIVAGAVLGGMRPSPVYGEDYAVAPSTRITPLGEDGKPLEDYTVKVVSRESERQPSVTFNPIRVQGQGGFTLDDVNNAQVDKRIFNGEHDVIIIDETTGHEYRLGAKYSDGSAEPSSGTSKSGSSSDQAGASASSAEEPAAEIRPAPSKSAAQSSSAEAPSSSESTSAESKESSSSAGGSSSKASKSESGSASEDSPEEAFAKEAAKKLGELAESYGEPATREDGNVTYAEGLCLVEPIDFDGDGVDELLIAYYDEDAEESNHAPGDTSGDYKYRVEVWGSKEGKLQVLHEQHADHSSGGFAFLRTCEGPIGLLIESNTFIGEGKDVANVRSLYSYDGDTFGEAVNITVEGLYNNDPHYYLNGEELSMQEYGAITDGPGLGLDSYVSYQFASTDSSAPSGAVEAIHTASDIVARAKENLAKLKAAPDGKAADAGDAGKDASEEAFAGFPVDFMFTSGAGGWRSSITVDPDGSFSGAFEDTNFGETGDGYPNGTVYRSTFEGKFTAPTKISDKEYQMQIEYLRLIDEPGESITDGIREVYIEDAYGLGKPSEEPFGDVRLYLPGRSTSDLSKEFLIWVYYSGSQHSELDRYALDIIDDDTGSESGWGSRPV